MQRCDRREGGTKDSIELDRLFRFAIDMNNRSLCSRLGYLLERFGTDADALVNCASREYVKLDPARPKSRVWDKKWRVNVNLGDTELLGWRET